MHKRTSLAQIGALIAILFTAQLALAQEVEVTESVEVTTQAIEEVSVQGESVADVSVTSEEAAGTSIDAESAGLAADAVMSNEDLSLYTTATMKRDAKIDEVTATKDRVTLTYQQHARLLGIIPGTIRATATVSSNGNVDIDYPWYRFLFKVKGTADAEEMLAARVAEILAGQTDTSFSAADDAQILEAMHFALGGSASAIASQGTTADTAGPALETSGEVEETVSDEEDIEVN